MELTPEIIKKLTPDQMELLIELGDLAKKEEALSMEIDTIRRQEEKVGLSRNNHTIKTLHEDSEFVNLLSLRAIREREIIRDKISGLIRSLVSAGLGDLGIVQRQAANYNVKI